MKSLSGLSLPAQWSCRPLKRVTTVLRRGTAPDYVPDSSVRVIGQAANQQDGFEWEETGFHNYAGNPHELRDRLTSGDIVINSTGTGTVGRVGFFTKSPDKRTCVADGHLTLARADRHMHPRFLYYYLSSKPFQGLLLSSFVVGATNQIELNSGLLGTAPVPVPSLEEQRHIADFLDAETAQSQELTEVYARTRELLLERRDVAVHKLVTGVDHQGQASSALSWTSSLPSHWDVVKLSLLARMGSGHTPSRSHPEWWVDCEIPWITTGEVRQVRGDRREVITETRECISELGLENSAAELHPAGTVVLCRTASAGYSAVMGSDMATSQDFVTWTCGPQLDPYYLLWCLRAMRPHLLGGLATGSTHQTIYMPDLQMLRVPVPPLEEQREVVGRIKESNALVDATIDAIDRQVELLSERRQALVTAAVMGQMDATTARSRIGYRHERK